MGCTCSAPVYVVDEVHSKDTTSCLLPVAVLQRPRNFQWYWTSIKRKEEEEEWKKYSDVENEIIEDAYNENMMKTIEIDQNYIIDFKHWIQYDKKSSIKNIQIKRVQLNQNRTMTHLREDRFGGPVLIIDMSIPPLVKQQSLPERFWKLELESKTKTMGDLAENAALGMIKVGTTLGKVHESQWLAKQLFAVKHFGNDIKAHYSRVPKQIGETCVYLYTKESFWYKSIYNFLRRPDVITDEQLRIYGPFCHLLHWYLKKMHRTHTTMTVYRNLNLNDEQRIQFRKPNIKFTLFTSTTKRRDIAESFGNTLLVIYLNIDERVHTDDDVICGADIMTLSDYPDEEEFLIWPGSQFRFVKEEYDETKTKHILYLQSLHNHYI